MINTETSTPGIGNELYRILQEAMALVFNQGELGQLTHNAFDHTVASINNSTDEEITISYPVGYGPEKQPILRERKYEKKELQQRYEYLAFSTLPANGIYQLATIIETMLGDLIRRIVLEFPAKLGSKRQIALKEVLEANSLPDLHIRATDALLKELSYKSPKEFAKEAETIFSINLLECAAYHSYIEMKATRDVLLHNKGIANDTYTFKAGSHARTQSGMKLPVTQVYFLEVYESCLQLIEWLELELHQKWYSSEFVARSKENHNDT